MTIKPEERPWYGIAEWKVYLRDCRKQGKKFINHAEGQYKYLSSVEKIRDLTDSEAYFIEAYGHMINGEGW